MAIVLRSLSNPGQQIVVSSSPIRIGRSSENQLVLEDLSVSRQHALVQLEGGVPVITDLKSSRGVKVNGVGVTRSPLKPGDMLEIGAQRFQVVQDTSVQEGSAAPRPAGQAGGKAGSKKTSQPAIWVSMVAVVLVLFVGVLSLGGRKAPGEAPTPAAPEAPGAIVSASSPTQAADVTADPAQPPAATAPAQIPAVAAGGSEADFKAWMKTAHILLYEDMVNVANHPTPLDQPLRYAKNTLDTMGLKQYVDVAGAIGDLKTKLLNGAGAHQPWDLIILAAESRSSVQGDLFTLVKEALDEGSSVVLEVWYLDVTAEGKAGSILGACGLEWQGQYGGLPAKQQYMWPVKTDNPILHTPNDNLSFTNVTSYWDNIYDLGDYLMVSKRNPKDAQLLITKSEKGETNRNGLAAACLGNRLVLQSFSSHSLVYRDTMALLWENYIYNTLRARYETK